MQSAIIDEIRSLFNQASGCVRLITFLSPTCGPCRYGQGIVRGLFEESPAQRLAGFVVRVPMLSGDNADSAMVEQLPIADSRLHFWYDADKAAADTWSSFIGLAATTWDVYAVYDADAVWPEGGPPPPPRIW